ncbi:protein Hikeshi-like [Tubulanus polymorphus]|uniref:protein Hikeshi-like n=1 Tax=Tubulanus polymorphus TaxID=672921 RepID=UPI003DA4FEC6
MFGVLVAGRLVSTDLQRVSETQVIFTIPDADNVNHVVVFMTGTQPFPDDVGGAVYFSWPNPTGPAWQLLGHITNTKPSAIFRISNLKKDASGVSVNPFTTGIEQHHIAQIGISAEPLAQLAQQTPVANASVSNVSAFVEFTQKMLENFVNFATSFAVTQSQMIPQPTETYVPLSTLQKWFETFQRKLQMDPYFWRNS